MKVKKILLVIGLIAIMLGAGLLGGCYRGSDDNGKISTKTFDYKDFTAIEIQNDFEVEITYADNYSITISGTDRAMGRLDVSKSGDTLKIRMSGWQWFGFWNTSPKAVITLPELRRLDLSGASSGSVSGFKTDKDFALQLSGASSLDVDLETGDFNANVSGASDLNLYLKAITFDGEASGASTIKGRLETGKTDIRLTGASDARLTGSGSDLVLHCSGASGAKLADFTVKTAEVNLSGASGADIDARDTLDVDISGASTLNYYGNPVLGKTEISGASDLNHKNQ
jgi:hypothetical protein